MASIAGSENTALGSSGAFVSVQEMAAPFTPPPPGHWFYAWDSDKA